MLIRPQLNLSNETNGTGDKSRVQWLVGLSCCGRKNKRRVPLNFFLINNELEKIAGTRTVVLFSHFRNPVDKARSPFAITNGRRAFHLTRITTSRVDE